MKDILKKCIITTLTLEAKMVLRRFKPTVIAITGSVGKTSTKDAIFSVLSPLVYTARSKKSFNGDIGVPLSILQLPNGWNNYIRWVGICIQGFLILFRKMYPSYLILEVGADKPKDISSIASWIKPKYSVFTRFPEVPVHIEFYDSKEQVIQEKKSLAKYTRSNGVLILNHDDPLVYGMKDEFTQKIRSYGENKQADIALTSFLVVKKDGLFVGTGTIVYKNHAYQLSIPGVVSKTHILSALPGILIALEEGYTFTQACEGLNRISPTHGRFFPLRGLNGSVLIDDTYNSSPVAVMHALATVKSLPEMKRCIVVLGDMMELGSFSEEEHRKIGAYVPRIADILITVGTRSKFIHDEAIKQGVKNARWFDTVDKVSTCIQDLALPGDVILFKASQSIRLERALKVCLADENDVVYLVRQDKEWQER